MRIQTGSCARRGCATRCAALPSASSVSLRMLPSMLFRVLLCALLCVLSCALFAALSCKTLAFADDSDNAINPQQLPDSSFIYDTSITDLAGADAYFDNQTVQVVGEVVGDAINMTLDDSHKWITLVSPDGASASVTVFVPSDAVSRIDTFGGYGKTGTTLQVRGTFHLVCSEHDGLTDLHANHVSVTKKGSTHADELDWYAFVPGAACLVVGFLLMFVFSCLRERQR